MILFLCIGANRLAFGQGTSIISLSDTDSCILANPYQLLIFEDSTRVLSIEDVTSAEFQSKFKVIDSTAVPKLERGDRNYWVRIQIRNKSNHSYWIFENMDSHIESFEFYIPNSFKGYQKFQAGFSIPFSARSFFHKNFIFRFPSDTSLSTFYIKANSRIKDPLLFKIQTVEYFSYYSLQEYGFLGLFYGIMIIMAVYNILLYFSLREKVLLYYVFYIISGILFSLIEDGLGFQFFWSNWPGLNWIIGAWSPSFMMITFSVYAVSFLEIRKYFPKGFWLLIASIGGCIALTILNQYFDVSIGAIPYNLLPYCIIYYFVMYRLWNDRSSVVYFFIAYTILMASIVILFLRYHGVTFWSDVFTIYSFNLALIAEAVIFSFSIGENMRKIKEEKLKIEKQRNETQYSLIKQLEENQLLKDNLNRELEEKVVERTAEISRQNEIIQRLNSILNSQNIKLKDDVKTITKSRVLQKAVSFQDFQISYPDEESCINYLSDLKWKSGFSCKKCNYDSWSVGKSTGSHRCNRCGYDESATVNTVFHNCKFPLIKAFYIAYLVSNRKNFSVEEVSNTLQLRRQTCLEFKKKANDFMTGKKPPKNLNEDWGYLLIGD